jgi:hypothetical protein
MTRIDRYEFGRIVVDGHEETRDLIVLPGQAVRRFAELDPACAAAALHLTC